MGYEIKPEQYKIEQDKANKLYRKLKHQTGFFDFKERRILKRTLHERCRQEIFLKKTSIKITWVARISYEERYGFEGPFRVLKSFLYYDPSDTGGIVTGKQCIHYANIEKAVFNSKMQRLEIYGKLDESSDRAKKDNVLMIYNLFDMQYVMNGIKSACGIEWEKT